MPVSRRLSRDMGTTSQRCRIPLLLLELKRKQMPLDPRARSLAAFEVRVNVVAVHGAAGLSRPGTYSLEAVRPAGSVLGNKSVRNLDGRGLP